MEKESCDQEQEQDPEGIASMRDMQRNDCLASK